MWQTSIAQLVFLVIDVEKEQHLVTLPENSGLFNGWNLTCPFSTKLHADLRAAGQSSFVALEKASQGDFPSKAATQGLSHYESWISNSESGEVLCSKATLLGHVSQNSSLPGPSAPLWSFLPRMIHTSGTTMRWEPCAYTTRPPPPCCSVCLLHTHRHTHTHTPRGWAAHIRSWASLNGNYDHI